MPKVAIEPIVGVLPDRTGVEHDDVGARTSRRALVARLLEQAGQALGVVHVHLTPVGADLEASRGGACHATRLDASTTPGGHGQREETQCQDTHCQETHCKKPGAKKPGAKKPCSVPYSPLRATVR